MDTTELDEQVAPRRNKRRRALLAILLSSSLATLGAGAMSLAVFSDSQAAGGSWSTGTIILGVNPAVVFNPTAIMPGDFGSQAVTVANTGTGDLRYAMSSVSDNLDGQGLRDALNLHIYEGACGGGGADVYATASLNGASFGSNAQGNQGGDRVLAAGTSEVLCFAWDFPLTVSAPTLQDAATTAIFTFDAEQTKNN
jgi:hypothetical protein